MFFLLLADLEQTGLKKNNSSNNCWFLIDGLVLTKAAKNFPGKGTPKRRLALDLDDFDGWQLTMHVPMVPPPDKNHSTPESTAPDARAAITCTSGSPSTAWTQPGEKKKKRTGNTPRSTYKHYVQAAKCKTVP